MRSLTQPFRQSEIPGSLQVKNKPTSHYYLLFLCIDNENGHSPQHGDESKNGLNPLFPKDSGRFIAYCEGGSRINYYLYNNNKEI
jgi:hypothetical protein